MTTSLTYKNDWEEAKDRFRMWWKGEYFGRCGLAVSAPLDNPPDVPPPPEPESAEQRWYDLDMISKRQEYQLSRRFWGGEALPTWSAGYAGQTAQPTFFGCPIELDQSTGWWQPILTEPDSMLEVPSLTMDESCRDYQFMIEMLKRGSQEAMTKSLVSLGAIGGCGDTLAALRGSEQLLYDCLERPEQIRSGELHIMDEWCRLYDTCYSLTHEVNEGSTCWFGMWSPGKFYAVQNDFSYNIGPEMFCDIFLPAIERQTGFLDHSVYHVDGVNSFVHVDALCTLPALGALQILPGAGKPSPLHYMDVLKKVQEAGKNLHISIEPGEVELALAQLSARGLMIHTWTDTEYEARELLAKAELWSVDR